METEGRFGSVLTHLASRHQNWRRGIGLNRKTICFASVATDCYGCEPMLKLRSQIKENTKGTDRRQ